MPAAAPAAPFAHLSPHELVADVLERTLRPPPEITVDVWAEQHRWLEKRTTAAAGNWRNEKTPYLVEPQRCMTEPAVRAVVLMKGAQTGGSEIAINWLCRQAECNPGPAVWVTSSDAQVRKISRRIRAMFDRQPLRARLATRRSRQSGNSTSEIVFENGDLGIVSAQSPMSLSSDPKRDAVCDEVDLYSESSGGQGDALDMVNARQQTYERSGAKTMYVSTPSIEGTSKIAALYEASDQRRYMVPCPECGALQELVWAGERESDGHKFGVRWDETLPVHLQPRTAYYQCAHCPARWNDAQRWAAVQLDSGACWVATKPFGGVAGFHIPGLISTFVRLADCVKRWISAVGRPSRLQTFHNLVLGLPFSLTADRAPTQIPLEAWVGYEVPEEAVLLLGFADVQADRLEATFVGVGADEALFPVEHRIFQGSTDLAPVWAELEAYMLRKWSRSDGRVIGLSAFGVDCSYRWEAVCDWAAQVSRKQSLRVFSLRGVSRGVGEPIVRERVPGRTHGGRWFYNVNSDASKLAVIQKLRLKPGQRGAVRYPARECFSDAYFEQLRSEKLVRRLVRGFPKLEWHLPPGTRNEALDCLAGVLGVKEWLNPALDVLALRNPKVTEPLPAAPLPAVAPDAPGPLARFAAALAAQARELAAERAASAEPAPAPPQVPAPPPPRVLQRQGGAWFDNARGPRLRGW